MPSLTIGRMANLYGLHRSTLHEAVKKGRLSSVLDETGSRVIELSEMIRVYGEPKALPYTSLHHQEDASPTPPTPDVGALMDEIKMLRTDVFELKQLLMRIEHKPDLPEKTPKKPQSFADLLASL